MCFRKVLNGVRLEKAYGYVRFYARLVQAIGNRFTLITTYDGHAVSL